MQGDSHGNEAPSSGDGGQPVDATSGQAGQTQQPKQDDRSDGVYRPLPAFDFAAWLGPEAAEPPAHQLPKKERRGKAGAAEATQRGHEGGQAADNRVERARAYVMSAGFPESIEGDFGHGALFRCACVLIDDFGLNRSDALMVLGEYNQAKGKPPEDDYQLNHKIDQAMKKHPRPSLKLLMEGLAATNGQPAGEGLAGLPALPPGMDLDIPEGMEENPHRLARIFIQNYNHALGRLVHYWNEEFWKWDGSKYKVTSREEIKSELTCVIELEFDRLFNAELAKSRGKKEKYEGDDEAPRVRKPKLRNASTRLIGDVLQALKSMITLYVDDVPAQPCWLNTPHEWSGIDIIPTSKTLIHLPSYISGMPYSIPSTPQFFNSNSLSYDITSIEDIGDPHAWLEFLNQLWPESPESIALLQEWFGYMLTPDTSHQKILLLIGDKRSGKGTIARVLTQVVGEANVVNPTLGSLTNQFGLHPLFGKSVAIISDARLSNRQDKALIVERLLSISGEDMQTIERKHRDSITVKLPTRFLIISNEIPHLRDDSGAFTSRTICLELTRSFLGRENRKLFLQLSKELPQIFGWSVAGWKRLRERDYFEQPKAAQELVEEMDDSSSRIRAFVKELCTLEQDNPECTVLVSTLFGQWKLWNQERELDPRDRDSFGRQLRAAFRFIKRDRVRVNGELEYRYREIRLTNPPPEYKVNTVVNGRVVEYIDDGEPPY